MINELLLLWNLVNSSAKILSNVITSLFHIRPLRHKFFELLVCRQGANWVVVGKLLFIFFEWRFEYNWNWHS